MKRTSLWILGLWLPGGVLGMATAQAQSDQSQLVRPLGAADLNSNLARLSANPRDTVALIGAGEAALALDDPRAAAGFFARADAIESGNGRIKAGLARVMLKLQNPGEALRLFDQAGRLGYPDTTILSDRGLARDMTGDQAGAQRDYQAALARTPDDDETIRRYAASLGIAGQVEASNKILEPLLYKSDRAAWRYRAFILAMNNKQAEARTVADQTMPAQLAAAITPYMQKMPYLTAAQKAAAVHFGHFPAQIGISIAAITPTPPAPGITLASKAPVKVAAAPATPPKSQAASRTEQRRARREAARLARAEGLTAARTAPATVQKPLPQPNAQQPAATQPTGQQPRLAQAQTVPPRAIQPTATPTPAPVQQAAATPAPTASAPAAPTAPAQVQALPSNAPAPRPSAAVPSSALSSSAVQGPPAPGFESIDNGPSTPPSATPPSSAGQQLNAIALAQASPPPAPATPEPDAPTPSTTIAPTAPETAPAPAMVQSTMPPQPDPAATRTLADIIRAIDVPEAERQSSVAAVDLTEIAAMQAARRAERQAAATSAAEKVKKAALAKAKVEADAKAKKEAEEKKRLADNPSRNWLQIGVGQSKSALGFTMKGLRKKYDSLSAQEAWSAGWGRTNRLLVGPFASFARAKTVEDKLKAAGADVFAWKSDAGEVVERLAGD